MKDDERNDELPGSAPDRGTDLPPELRDEEADAPLKEGAFGEAIRAAPELADIAVSLLLTAFPRVTLMRAAEGRLAALYTDPPLTKAERRRLLGYLFELVERPEWRSRHAVAREVTDVKSTRLELLLPLAPETYDGGEAVVGPFASQEEAHAWGSGVAETGLAFDTLPSWDAYLVDLFQLGQLLDD